MMVGSTGSDGTLLDRCKRRLKGAWRRALQRARTDTLRRFTEERSNAMFLLDTFILDCGYDAEGCLKTFQPRQSGLMCELWVIDEGA